MKKGDYNAAVKAFGDVKSNNAALAQILTKDYSKAKATLAGVELLMPIHTICGLFGCSYQQRTNGCFQLEEIYQHGSSKAQQAATDLEFAKFDIASLVK